MGMTGVGKGEGVVNRASSAGGELVAGMVRHEEERQKWTKTRPQQTLKRPSAPHSSARAGKVDTAQEKGKAWQGRREVRVEWGGSGGQESSG